MKQTFFLLLTFLLSFVVNAQEVEMTEAEQEVYMSAMQASIDSIEKTFTYQTGTIQLASGNASLEVPAGFGYLDPIQAKRVLEELWGNPPGETLGLLVPQGGGVLQDNTWAFDIEWDEMGYVEDDDAGDTDYDELLVEMRKDADADNQMRAQQGYPSVELVGWASPPYYDKENKVLHWAKNLKFADSDINTLNYNVRILGRKGIMVVNAIGNIDQLSNIQTHIEAVMHSVKFNDGERYADFSSSSGDKVAAYTIGGLIAGKVLAKVGLFAVILKFGKIIFIAIAAAAAAIWRFLRGKKAKREEMLALNELPAPKQD